MLVGAFFLWWQISVTNAVLLANTPTTIQPIVRPSLSSQQNKINISPKEKSEKSLAAALQATSLRHSEVDRPQLSFVNGQWQINGTVLWYFDYFLSLEGEKSIQTITQLFKIDVDAHYEPQLAKQLYDLFLRYVAYLQAVAQKEADVSEADIISQHLNAKTMQNEVQAHYFSEEEIHAIFSDFDAKLTSLTTRLSQKAFDHFEQHTLMQNTDTVAYATEAFGPIAAQNLLAVRYRRQEWQGRVVHFQQEKAIILRAYSNDNEGAEQAISALEARLFNEQEIKRVHVLTRKKE